ANRLGDPQALAVVHGRSADHAVRQGSSGRALLPPELHAQFDAVIQAVAQAEAGQDDLARTTLQAIGLQSPFLEWKVFLRGLLAYYGKDDVRALENWQRLDTQRLPAHLAAPFRFQIDAGFRASQ